jgi:predicted nucleic acid-binding protein
LKAGIDTNFLVYAEKYDDGGRYDAVRQIIDRAGSSLVVSVLALGELYRVLTRKAKRNPDTAAADALAWTRSLSPCDVDFGGLEEAMLLSAKHQLHIWDALAVTTYRRYGCSIILSEDMQDGFVWQGIEVVNPFKRPLEPLLRLLEGT